MQGLQEVKRKLRDVNDNGTSWKNEKFQFINEWQSAENTVACGRRKAGGAIASNKSDCNG